MNNIEESVILYYADFLSLKEQNIPLTDNCKYFYIHGIPINCAYMVDKTPWFDKESKYYKQAQEEYKMIYNKFGEDGVVGFVENICNLQAMGAVNAEQMLNCIHMYSDKQTKKAALKEYYKWKKNQRYSHLTINENEDPQRIQCSRYIARAEQNTIYEPKVDIKDDIKKPYIS